VSLVNIVEIEIVSFYVWNLLFSKLTAQQKSLLLTYAETENAVDGTVNGIAQTKEGTDERTFTVNTYLQASLF